MLRMTTLFFSVGIPGVATIGMILFLWCRGKKRAKMMEQVSPLCEVVVDASMAQNKPAENIQEKPSEMVQELQMPIPRVKPKRITMDDLAATVPLIYHEAVGNGLGHEVEWMSRGYPESGLLSRMERYNQRCRMPTAA